MDLNQFLNSFNKKAKEQGFDKNGVYINENEIKKALNTKDKVVKIAINKDNAWSIFIEKGEVSSITAFLSARTIAGGIEKLITISLLIENYAELNQEDINHVLEKLGLYDKGMLRGKKYNYKNFSYSLSFTKGYHLKFIIKVL